jgi:hypothetical protein
MNVHLAQNAVEELFGAPLPVQKAFIKRINFLVRNLNHARFAPRSLTRVRAVGGPASMTTVRFYFTIGGDTYRISEIMPHPK